MKNLLTSIILCSVAMATMAQNKAEIEVSYTVSTPSLRYGKTSVINQYILLANSSESKFYSPKTEYIDSLNSTPEDKAILQEMTRNAYLNGKMDETPGKDGNNYVLKSFTGNILRYYDSAGPDRFFMRKLPKSGTGISRTQPKKFSVMNVWRQPLIFMVANGRYGSLLRFRCRMVHGNSTDCRD